MFLMHECDMRGKITKTIMGTNWYDIELKNSSLNFVRYLKRTPNLATVAAYWSKISKSCCRSNALHLHCVSTSAYFCGSSILFALNDPRFLSWLLAKRFYWSGNDILLTICTTLLRAKIVLKCKDCVEEQWWPYFSLKILKASLNLTTNVAR